MCVNGYFCGLSIVDVICVIILLLFCVGFFVALAFLVSGARGGFVV